MSATEDYFDQKRTARAGRERGVVSWRYLRSHILCVNHASVTPECGGPAAADFRKGGQAAPPTPPLISVRAAVRPGRRAKRDLRPEAGRRGRLDERQRRRGRRTP